MSSTGAKKAKKAKTSCTSVGKDLDGAKSSATKTPTYKVGVIFGVDTKGNVTEWNFPTAGVTGCCRDDALGKPLVSTFVPPSFRKSFQKALDVALEGEESSNYELALQTRQGHEPAIVLVHDKIIRDCRDIIDGVTWFGQCFTGRFYNGPKFGIDSTGEVVLWNDKMEAITGYSKEEALGKSFVTSFVPFDFRGGVETMLTKAMKGEVCSHYEMGLEQDSRWNYFLHVDVEVETMKDFGGNIVGVVGYAKKFEECCEGCDGEVVAASSKTECEVCQKDRLACHKCSEYTPIDEKYCDECLHPPHMPEPGGEDLPSDVDGSHSDCNDFYDHFVVEDGKAYLRSEI